jgi:hypothetical protein
LHCTAVQWWCPRDTKPRFRSIGTRVACRKYAPSKGCLLQARQEALMAEVARHRGASPRPKLLPLAQGMAVILWSRKIALDPNLAQPQKLELRFPRQEVVIAARCSASNRSGHFLTNLLILPVHTHYSRSQCNFTAVKSVSSAWLQTLWPGIDKR